MKKNIKISKNMFLATFLILVLIIIVWIGEKTVEKEDIEKIPRSSYGGPSKTETYVAEIDGKEEDITIQISPQIYEEAELQRLMLEAMEVLKIRILGKNESLEYVTENLELLTILEGYPFRITWELDRYDVISFSGELKQEKILEADPEQTGVPVVLTAILTYEGMEAQESIDVILFHKEIEKTQKEELSILVETIESETREDKYLKLPQRINGKRIVWKKAEESSVGVVAVLGIIVIFLLIIREKQQESQQKKERNKEMLVDYPEIVSQFTMLMGAGMTPKKVWYKIAEDYRKQKRESGRTRASYEEFLITCQEMQSGIPEAECYQRFAKRCELLPYMKLGVLLAQNLKKGSKGLSEMLALEAITAMEERKTRARKLGEEAGTKLLIPMMLMLIVVFAIVIIPAFWSAQL